MSLSVSLRMVLVFLAGRAPPRCRQPLKMQLHLYVRQMRRFGHRLKF